MTKWYVNELSRISGVSVQTLHYYDRIGLLKPTARLESGYRLYCEADLSKLQQIVAFKFFGFPLKEIKLFLREESEGIKTIKMQAMALEKKAENLQKASKALNKILQESSKDKTLTWKTLIKSIEVYHMTQKYENNWVKEALTPQELEQYAQFEADLAAKPSKEKETFSKEWKSVVDEINANLDTDPKSKAGYKLAEKVMKMIGDLYGKEHANLKKSLWEKGFKKNKMDEEHLMTPENVAWLDKATDNYWRTRITALLNEAGENAPADLEDRWNVLLEEMYGDYEEPKKELVAVALKEPGISDAAKAWLQSL